MPDGKGVRVQISSYGNLLLPAPVEARFANGARQRFVLDRSREEQTLEFTGPAPLTEVVIDPDYEFPLVIPPPEIDAARLAELTDALPYRETTERPLRLYHRAIELEIKDFRIWNKLGQTLFDGQHYPESLDAFNRAAPFVDDNNLLRRFGVLVWRGMLHDLLGRRETAFDFYKQALQISGNRSIEHPLFGLVFDRAWVEKRLETPFTRPMVKSK
jgi:tetratricopeptide (TPR) repeat protein